MTLMRIVILMMMLACAASAQLATKKSMTLAAAKQIATAAEQEAIKNKWNVVIAITDDAGYLVYLQRMDDTQTGSIDVAQQKALTSARFKRPTKAFVDTLAGGNQGVLKLPIALPVEGGLPLMVDGKVVGAIGVSGVTAQQDGVVAAAGVAVFEKMK